MKREFILLIAPMLLFACSGRQESTDLLSQKQINVKAVDVKKEKVFATLQYSGTVEAYQTIPLTFEMTGTVERVLVEAGDKVHKGQLVATLKQTDARNMLQITQSQYQQAKDAYDRLKTVHDLGSLPDIKWVEMESKLQQASSSLELAKNNLDKCNLYSPVDGTVGSRNAEPGMSAISLTAAPIEIVDIRQVYIKVSVPENEVSKIRKGMKAKITVTALDGKSFDGEIAVISPVADRISRTYETKLLLQNPGEVLKPGMVCDVNMEQAMEKEVMLVPFQSVSKDHENRTYVFIVDETGKKAIRQNITTGQCFEGGIEVLSGLTPGQKVISEGKEKLNDNCQIAL
jgi:RND family efflux transporter MFP subunit